MSSTVRSTQGDTLDLIVWRHYGNQPGVLEHVLEANTHLRHQDAALVPGTLVTLPKFTPQPAPTQVRLWS